MARFRTASLQKAYDTMLALAADKTSELYHQGQPRRGAGHRAAFWDGFNGMTLDGKTRSPHVIRGTLSHACWAAGVDWKKRT